VDTAGSDQRPGQREMRPRAVPPVISKQRSLFSVMGQKVAGSATALVIAASEVAAEFYSRRELSFVSITATVLVSDSVYDTCIDTRRFQASD
jgi:hypothetical protein